MSYCKEGWISCWRGCGREKDEVPPEKVVGKDPTIEISISKPNQEVENHGDSGSILEKEINDWVEVKNKKALRRNKGKLVQDSMFFKSDMLKKSTHMHVHGLVKEPMYHHMTFNTDAKKSITGISKVAQPREGRSRPGSDHMIF